MTADLAALTGMDVPTGLFIGGEWTTNGRTIGVTNPATEDTLVENVEAHFSADHPDLVGKYSREEILEMAHEH